MSSPLQKHYQIDQGPTHRTAGENPFGWHVIRLDDVRPLKVPPFEEIKQNLAQRVLQRQFRHLSASCDPRQRLNNPYSNTG